MSHMRTSSLYPQVQKLPKERVRILEIALCLDGDGVLVLLDIVVDAVHGVASMTHEIEGRCARCQKENSSGR